MKTPVFKSIAFLFVILIAASFSATAQSTRETLTNAKIVELVGMGLGDDLIIQKIRQSDCKCDTSTAGIGKLKAARVSDAIIMAMMNQGGAGYSDSQAAKNNDTGPNPTRADAYSGLGGQGDVALRQINEPGIYLYEDGKMTFMEPTVYSGSKAGFLGTALTYGIMKTKIRAVIRGRSANMQVVSRRPEFYFVFSREYSNSAALMSGFGGYSATSPAEFMMIEMKVKQKSREAVLGEFSAYSSSTGAADRDIREYAFEKIKPGVYKVVPKTDLTTGEYCFYYAGTGGAGSKVFDFGIK